MINFRALQTETNRKKPNGIHQTKPKRRWMAWERSCWARFILTFDAALLTPPFRFTWPFIESRGRPTASSEINFIDRFKLTKKRIEWWNEILKRQSCLLCRPSKFSERPDFSEQVHRLRRPRSWRSPRLLENLSDGRWWIRLLSCKMLRGLFIWNIFQIPMTDDP